VALLRQPALRAALLAELQQAGERGSLHDRLIPRLRAC